METGTWLGFGALLVSAAGALNSMRSGRREDRSSAVVEIQAVVQTLKQEIDRLKAENKEAEQECRQQIAECNQRLQGQQSQIQEMRETIVRQAGQLGQLDQRARQRP